MTAKTKRSGGVGGRPPLAPQPTLPLNIPMPLPAVLPATVSLPAPPANKPPLPPSTNPHAAASSSNSSSGAVALASSSATSTPIAAASTTPLPPQPAELPPPPTPPSRARVYRTVASSTATPGSGPGGASAGGGAWATREIAALDFLLGIPLAAERSIVRAGLNGAGHRRGGGGGLSAPGTPKSSRGVDDDARIVAVGSTLDGVTEESHHEEDGSLDSDGLRRRGSELMTATVSSADDHSSLSAKQSAPAARRPTLTLSQPQRWWEKLILKDKGFFSVEAQQARRRARLDLETRELERPTDGEGGETGDRGTSALSSRHGDDSCGAPAFVGGDDDDALAQDNDDSVHDDTLPRQSVAPGRRLDGRDATAIALPHTDARTAATTKQRSIAWQATVREWEIQVAHGIGGAGSVGWGDSLRGGDEEDDDGSDRRGLLDGRAFFSSRGSYPTGVFSVIKYEPKKEEAARRRKKLEELGGGGTQFGQFVMPERDWRGISYRALLPRVEKKNKAFNRMVNKTKPTPKKKKKQSISPNHAEGDNVEHPSTKKVRRKSGSMFHDCDVSKHGDAASMGGTSHSDSKTMHPSDQHLTSEEEDYDTSSSEESDSYVPGFIDDPDMKLGRHRQVMVGDKVIGCVVSSIIQFVDPVDLKADLNKQFKERFDGWEPPKSQRKFIGARVIDGVYTLDHTLVDPTTPSREDIDDIRTEDDSGRRRRAGSMEKDIRMPPSLTLSKIRSIKQQALEACVRAKLEISTVALACVYFERLCLDCRVDKSNRRLTFAACLLLAAKINEANVAIVHDRNNVETKRGVLHSWIKPTKKSNIVFASLLEFFTHDWSLSLKNLFAAEWGVFAALGFDLHATPSQVAFHFKRFLKVLAWNPRHYLGHEMYNQWQESMMDESRRRERREERRELRRKRKERKLMNLQRELHRQTGESSRRRSSATSLSDERMIRDDNEEKISTQRDARAQNDQATSFTANGTGPVLTSTGQGKISPSKAEKAGGSMRGMWFRLGRPRHTSRSVEKDMDRLAVTSHPGEEMKIPLKRSMSSPDVGKLHLAEDRSSHFVIEMGATAEEERGEDDHDDKQGKDGAIMV